MTKKQRRRGMPTLFLLLLLLLLGDECHGETRALSFEDTLADDIRAAVATRCHNLDQRRERLKCVLTYALDSVGPATVHDSSSPSPESCKYRTEAGGQGSRLHKYATPPSQTLDLLLQSYDAMHRRCTATPLNLTTDSRNSSSKAACKCKYLVWGHGSFGLGNRLLSLVSAFVYALLSQRTLLLRFAEWPSLFCSPFPNSPYFTLNDPDFNPDRDGVYYQSFRAMGCAADDGDRRCADVGMVNLALHHGTTPEEHQFLVCPGGYAGLRNVAVVTAMFSNQFYAAAFAANPVLHDAFRLLFPGSDPFHALAPRLFTPADALWSEISRRLRRAGAGGAPARRFGVQLREFGGGYTPALDAAAAACVRRHAALCRGNRSSSSSAVAVYVASLDRRHVRGLRRALSGGVRGRRADVAWQAPAAGDAREGFDGAHLREAAADMWSLSAADVLVTTPWSTFGYVAHGLAGVPPFHLSAEAEAEACVGAVSYEPCFHFAPTSATICAGDGGRLASALAKSSGLIASCPDFPRSGWQLVPAPT